MEGNENFIVDVKGEEERQRTMSRAMNIMLYRSLLHVRGKSNEKARRVSIHESNIFSQLMKRSAPDSNRSHLV